MYRKWSSQRSSQSVEFTDHKYSLPNCTVKKMGYLSNALRKYSVFNIFAVAWTSWTYANWCQCFQRLPHSSMPTGDLKYYSTTQQIWQTKPPSTTHESSTFKQSSESSELKSSVSSEQQTTRFTMSSRYLQLICLFTYINPYGWVASMGHQHSQQQLT